MHQPGIEVRPIREMTGRAIFNEVFFTDARVLHDDVLGDVGGGWAVALTTLANERTMLGAGSFGSSGGGLSIRATDLGQRAGDVARAAESQAAAAAASSGAGDLLRSLVEEYGRASDPVFRQEVARIHTLLEIARYTDLRVRAAVERGGRPGPEVSVGKLGGERAAARAARDHVPRVRSVRDAVGGRRAAGRPRTRGRLLELPHFDRRRHRPGAAQHHRRAGARPAGRATNRQGASLLSATDRAHVTINDWEARASEVST